MNSPVMAIMQKTSDKVGIPKSKNQTTKLKKDRTFKNTFEEAKQAQSKASKVDKKDSVSTKRNDDAVADAEGKKLTKEVDAKDTKRAVEDSFEDLSAEEKDAVEALKALLKKLDIQVSDSMLLELAQQFDFSDILNSLKMLVESQQILETPETLLENLDSLDSMLSDLQEAMTNLDNDNNSVSEVKEKFENLLNQLNGHIEEIKLSSDVKSREKAVKDLLGLMKKTFNDPTLKKNIKAQNPVNHESNLIKSNEGQSKVENVNQKPNFQNEGVEVAPEEVKTEVDTNEKGSHNQNQSFNQESNGVVLTDENQVVIKEETIQNQVNFKEELNFRLLSKAEQTAKVFSQIKDGFTTKLDGKISEMKVLLDPKSLGKVELKLTIEKGNVLAEFEVESMVVKQAIESNLQDLRNALSEKGYNLDALNVNVGDEAEEQQESKENFYENIFAEVDEEESLEKNDLLVEESRLLTMMKRRAISYLG